MGVDYKQFDILHALGYINKNEPLWWDNNSKHPKEILSVKSFEKRLRPIGSYPLSHPESSKWQINLYVGDTTPIVLVPTTLAGINVTLFITASPYTPKPDHRNWDKYEPAKQQRLIHESISQIKKETREKKYWETSQNIILLPHIKGFFIEQIGNRYLYYPTLKTDFARIDNPNNGWEHYLIYSPTETKELKNSLKMEKLDYMVVFDKLIKQPVACRTENIIDILAEMHAIRTKKPDLKKDHYVKRRPILKTIESKLMEEVPYYNFNHNTEKFLVSYFPLKLPEIEDSIPIALTTRFDTGDLSFIRPMAIGIFHDLVKNGESAKLNILPFVNEEFAMLISEEASVQLGLDIYSVVLKSKKGNPRYSQFKK